MGSATKNLENDHIYILRLIDIMEIVSKTENPNIFDLDTIIFLIKNYADGVHHQKEEDLFFPLLEERGFSTQQGPVAVMLHEHTLGRNFVKGLSEALVLYNGGDKSAILAIRNNINGYIALLRNHISKENNILFRMADKVLSEDDNQKLTKEFAKVEIKIMEESILKIEKMEEFYKYQL